MESGHIYWTQNPPGMLMPPNIGEYALHSIRKLHIWSILVSFEGFVTYELWANSLKIFACVCLLFCHQMLVKFLSALQNP